MAATPPPPVSVDPPRPFDPPFDPSKPSLPISYPLQTLQELASRSYFDSFHFQFNKASVPLPEYSGGAENRRKLLVCHDMQGGYRDDVWVQGGENEGAYGIWHWHLMDVFVYFSHYLVSLPPPGWVNAAHTHGVKVLGTFLTEWEEGGVTCNTLLATKESAQIYAERLAELATALGFDGWLINVENALDTNQINNLKVFVHHLTQTLHDSVPGSLVIWYDAVTVDGNLEWQNKLTEKNKPFFDLCDGIFVNYTWKENYPKNSAAVAGERRFDVYMGIDVFGRNTYGGGQWNTHVALDLLKSEDVSAAIFAPGWVYETEQKPNFQTAQNRWWSLVEKSWGILQNYPQHLPFFSNFDQGHGYHFSIEGLQLSSNSWNNLSCQSFQVMLDDVYDPNSASMQAFVNFKDASYCGGANITLKGNLQVDSIFSKEIFHGHLHLQDQPVYISYSVKSEKNFVLGLSIELLSEKKEKSSILISNYSPALRLGHDYDEIISPRNKEIKVGDLDGAQWVIYETSLYWSNFTISSIHIVSTLKRPDEDKKANENIDNENLTETGSHPYYASLGHISMRTTEKMMDFPPADNWLTQAENIVWGSNSHADKSVSLNITWSLKTEVKARFLKYNIYAEKFPAQTDGSGYDENRIFLGIARVQACFVSEFSIPSGVTGLKFIIQVCGLDGACQQLDESPRTDLLVVH